MTRFINRKLPLDYSNKIGNGQPFVSTNSSSLDSLWSPGISLLPINGNRSLYRVNVIVSVFRTLNEIADMLESQLGLCLSNCQFFLQDRIKLRGDSPLSAHCVEISGLVHLLLELKIVNKPNLGQVIVKINVVDIQIPDSHEHDYSSLEDPINGSSQNNCTETEQGRLDGVNPHGKYSPTVSNVPIKNATFEDYYSSRKIDVNIATPGNSANDKTGSASLCDVTYESSSGSEPFCISTPSVISALQAALSLLNIPPNATNLSSHILDPLDAGRNPGQQLVKQPCDINTHNSVALGLTLPNHPSRGPSNHPQLTRHLISSDEKPCVNPGAMGSRGFQVSELTRMSNFYQSALASSASSASPNQHQQFSPSLGHSASPYSNFSMSARILASGQIPYHIAELDGLSRWAVDRHYLRLMEMNSIPRDPTCWNKTQVVMWANWAAKQFRVDSLRQAGRHFELLGHQLLALPSEEWRNLLITTSPVSSLSNSSITSSGNTASATTTSNLGGGGGSSLLSMAPSTQSSTPSSCSSNPKTVSSPASVSALLAFFTHVELLKACREVCVPYRPSPPTASPGAGQQRFCRQVNRTRFKGTSRLGNDGVVGPRSGAGGVLFAPALPAHRLPDGLMAGAYAAVAAAAAAAASSATGVGAGVVVSSPCSSLSMPSFSSSSTTATTSSIHYPRIGLTDLEAAGCSSPTTGLQNGSSSVFSQSVHQLATIHSPPQHPLGQSLRVSISNSASSINPTSNNVASTMQPGYHLPLSMRQSGYPGVTGRQASTLQTVPMRHISSLFPNIISDLHSTAASASSQLHSNSDSLHRSIRPNLPIHSSSSDLEPNASIISSSGFLNGVPHRGSLNTATTNSMSSLGITGTTLSLTSSIPGSISSSPSCLSPPYCTNRTSHLGPTQFIRGVGIPYATVSSQSTGQLALRGVQNVRPHPRSRGRHLFAVDSPHSLDLLQTNATYLDSNGSPRYQGEWVFSYNNTKTTTTNND